MFVSGRSQELGEALGEAKQLLVKVYDSAKRASAARRVARNLDVLVRGVAACAGGAGPPVEFEATPECRVGSQRILCAFGLLLKHILETAQEASSDAASEAFVPNVSHVLRAMFAHFRKQLGERGERDVERLLGNASSCRDALRMLGKVPSYQSDEGKRIIANMVSVADLTRKGFVNGDVSTVMSPRTVLTWAQNAEIFGDVAFAFRVTFLNKCDELERPVIAEYFQRAFGEDLVLDKAA